MTLPWGKDITGVKDAAEGGRTGSGQLALVQESGAPPQPGGRSKLRVTQQLSCGAPVIRARDQTS